jgi:hypothetical protein
VFDVRKKSDRDEIKFDELVDRDGLEEGPNGWSWFVLERVDMVRRMKKAGFDAFLDFEKRVEAGAHRHRRLRSAQYQECLRQSGHVRSNRSRHPQSQDQPHDPQQALPHHRTRRPGAVL